MELASPLSKRRAYNWKALNRYLQYGPEHLMMYVFGRFSIVRGLMLRLHRQKPAVTTLSPASSSVGPVDEEAVAQAVSRDGCFAGLRLRQDVVEQLLSFSSRSECFGDESSAFPFHYSDRSLAEQRYGRKLLLGRYNRAITHCRPLQTLAADPTLRSIARKYLKTEPVLIGARLWWSFAIPKRPDTLLDGGQKFHFDLDGYRALTFFFYLTDVGPQDGPHVYVRGSHVDKSLAHLVNIYKERTDEEINRRYGTARQTVVCGDAGFGFAEDTFGFHKGLAPEGRDRLIVQVRYGLRDYGTGQND